MTDSIPQRKFTFRRRQRLSGSPAFQRVFDGRCRKNAGPLVVHGQPNELAYLRLGLSVGRRVGNALTRNRVKRLLREAFRLEQHDWPIGYDLVVVVRPHQTLSMADYQEFLKRALRGIELEWKKRRKRNHLKARSYPGSSTAA